MLPPHCMRAPFFHGVPSHLGTFMCLTGEAWQLCVELMYILLCLCLGFKGHFLFFLRIIYLHPLAIFVLIFKELLERITICNVHCKNCAAFHLSLDFMMFLPGKTFKFTCGGIYFKAIFMAYVFSVISHKRSSQLWGYKGIHWFFFPVLV